MPADDICRPGRRAHTGRLAAGLDLGCAARDGRGEFSVENAFLSSEFARRSGAENLAVSFLVEQSEVRLAHQAIDRRKIWPADVIENNNRAAAIFH
jgi:hypothetical protein